MSEQSQKTIALVCAAGSSERFGAGASKVFLPISGLSVLRRAVQTLAQNILIEATVVMVRRDDIPQAVVELSGIESVHVIEGGLTRQESVYRGLSFAGATLHTVSADLVLVHDAARCLVSSGIVARVINAARRYSAATAGMPVTDTILKISSISPQGHPPRTSPVAEEIAGPNCSEPKMHCLGMVDELLVRSDLVAIQTPQVFRYDLLLAAHERAREHAFEATDDASLVHSLCPVVVVEGGRDNIKITYPEHVRFAEAHLAWISHGPASRT